MADDVIACEQDGCPATIPNHRWGRTKSGWFQTRDGRSWCPDHTPAWVADWRNWKAGMKPVNAVEDRCPGCKAGDHSQHTFYRLTKIPNAVRTVRLEGWECRCEGDCQA